MLKVDDVVVVTDTRFPDQFPIGTKCQVWDIRGNKDALYPIGIIRMDDEKEEPSVGWFDEAQLKQVEE